MGIARVQVQLARKSLLAEDAVTNTLHFIHADGPVAGSDTRGEILSAVTGMYEWWDGQGLFAPSLSVAANAHQAKFYDLDEGAPGPNDDLSGSPAEVATFTMDSPSSGGLPAELAAVLSMSAILGSVPEESGVTRPASRRRGRIYIGPLAVQALDTNSDNEVIVKEVYRTVILSGFQAMYEELVTNIPDPIHPAVYSAADGTARPLVAIHVDNAWDVQRRRGIKPTGRSTIDLDA